MATSTVSEAIEIDADIDSVWQLVSNPDNYPRWSPEASGIRRHTGSGPWLVGEVFTGSNRIWLPWSTSCRVVTASQPEVFAFDVTFGILPVARWSYELAPNAEGGTLVTERWEDHRHGLRGAIVKPAGLLVGRGRDAATRNRATMRATLAHLKAEAERSRG
jgi:uncharacterized protein YndB with AHSA1/START domain